MSWNLGLPDVLQARQDNGDELAHLRVMGAEGWSDPVA